MKKLSLKLIASFLFLLILSSCTERVIGEGPIITEEIELSSFNRIDLRVSGELTIMQGNEQSVMITGQQNIIEKLSRKVKDQKWEIEFSSGNYKYQRLEILVIVPDINRVALSGSGFIVVKDFDNMGNLKLTVSGSGDIDLENLDGVDYIDAVISGSGSINGFGLISELSLLEISISGSGNLNGFDMAAKHCDILISGSGNCRVLVEESLDINISGSGSVYYKGDPATDIRISGSGTVVDAN